MVVTLTTDFGTADGYVGEMKGVILGRAASAELVDVTHEIPPGDVRAGAWVLSRIWARFPEGTVHLVVVDPGVGGDRDPVAARVADRWFVGPDNGLLTRVLREGPSAVVPDGWRVPADRAGGEVGAGSGGEADAGPAAAAEVRRLDPDRLGLPEPSDTFHGRDLFAPAAGHLAAGGAPDGLGPSLAAAGLVRLPWPEPSRRGRELSGTVVHVDRFGNLVTNLPTSWLPDRPVAEVGGREVRVLGRSFAAVEPGRLVLIRGSGGTLEIAARDASAAEALGVGRDDPVRVRPAANPSF